MASPYDIPTTTPQGSGNPYDLPSPTLGVSPSSTPPPTPVQRQNPSLLGDIGSGIGDAITGIKDTIGSFIHGAVGGFKAAQAAAPVQPSVKDFFLPSDKFGPSPLGGNENGAEHALDLGAQSLGQTLSDAGNKMKAAYQAFTTPGTTGLQKFAATGEAGIGALNVIFSPITSVLATVSAVPGVGHAANLVNEVFSAIGGGSAELASNAVDNAAGAGVISPQTAETIKPLAADTAALVGQILAGKAGGDVMTKVADNTHALATQVGDHIASLPPGTLNRGFIRNPFYQDPASPDAKGSVGDLTVDSDPASIAQKLKDMGVQSDIAESFAPKIAAAKDPTEVADILQMAKGAQNLADGGHLDTAQAGTPEAPKAPVVPSSPEEAATTYWQDKVQPMIDQGDPIMIGADDLKAHFGGDYSTENHPIYSKAAFDLYKRAMSESDNPDVAIFGGGPGSGKTELLGTTLKTAGFDGVVYDSTSHSYEGLKNAIETAKAAGKNPEIYGIIPDLEAARGHTFSREAATGRGVTDAAFARGHAGFPASIEKAITNGDIRPDQVHLLDTRGLTSKEDVLSAAQQGFHSDPLALVKSLGYNENDVRAKYGKESFAQRNPGLLQEPGIRERASELPGENRPAQEEAAAREAAQRPLGKTGTPGDFIDSLPKQEQDGLKPIVREIAKDTGAKVHLLDYLATPEFVLEKIGLGKQAKMLRTAFESYLDNRKIELAKIQDWKDKVEQSIAGKKYKLVGGKLIEDPKGLALSPGEASRTIFRYLDGQERETKGLMTPEMYDTAREIRSYLQDWAKRLGLPEDNRIAKYITHIFEPDFIQKDFDPELAKLIANEPPGSVYDPFLQQRLGKKGYIEDVWAALDAYVKRGTRKEAMDPALESLKDASYKLDEQSYNYVMKMAQRINMRPTELEKLVDNLIKQSFVGYRYGDRPIAYLSGKVRSLFYRGTLGLNIGSALRNLTQGVNTYAKLGEKYTAIGYTKLVYRLMSRNVQELYDTHVLDEQFVQDKKVGVYKTALQKADPILFGLFEQAEMINRGAAYFGAKAKAIAEGKSEAEAVDYAKRMVRETQFTFGSIDTPVALNDDAVKTLTQLQTYSIKQIEFLGRMAKNKEFGGLIRYTIGSFIALNTIGRVFGMTLNQLMPTVGVGGSPLGTLASNLAGLASSNPQTKQSAINGLKAQLWTLIPAGAQIRKTILGLEAYHAGKDTTPTGKTRFEIPQDTAHLLQAALFGKSALPEARQYYDSLGKKKAPSSAPYNR